MNGRAIIHILIVFWTALTKVMLQLNTVSGPQLETNAVEKQATIVTGIIVLTHPQGKLANRRKLPGAKQEEMKQTWSYHHHQNFQHNMFTHRQTTKGLVRLCLYI